MVSKITEIQNQEENILSGSMYATNNLSQFKVNKESFFLTVNSSKLLNYSCFHLGLFQSKSFFFKDICLMYLSVVVTF